MKVAPRAGAWIETIEKYLNYLTLWSHPVRVRGLKLVVYLKIRGLIVSHPVRVRGLKLRSVAILTPKNMSHPVRVRGLKHGLEPRYKITFGRTPCGCVD